MSSSRCTPTLRCSPRRGRRPRLWGSADCRPTRAAARSRTSTPRRRSSCWLTPCRRSSRAPSSTTDRHRLRSLACGDSTRPIRDHPPLRRRQRQNRATADPQAAAPGGGTGAGRVGIAQRPGPLRRWAGGNGIFGRNVTVSSRSYSMGVSFAVIGWERRVGCGLRGRCCGVGSRGGQGLGGGNDRRRL